MIVEIEWASFGGNAKKAFNTEGIPVGMTEVDFLEELFKATNLYTGPLWEDMQPLPDERTHTALSVGDFVSLEGVKWECKSLGWGKVE